MSYWDNPKPVLRARAVSVDSIAAKAVVLLDEGGIAELTVRALAASLGVAAPSLYSRIRSIDDVLDLALDRALEDDRALWQVSPQDGPHSLMLSLYDHLLKHPWGAQVIGMRAPRGPAYLRFSERLVNSLAHVSDPLTIAYAMSNLVIGTAATAGSAVDEPFVPVDRSHAPMYARLHSDYSVEPREVVEAGLYALSAMKR